jgi:hypothetical protein
MLLNNNKIKKIIIKIKKFFFIVKYKKQLKNKRHIY